MEETLYICYRKIHKLYYTYIYLYVIYIYCLMFISQTFIYFNTHFNIGKASAASYKHYSQNKTK